MDLWTVGIVSSQKKSGQVTKKGGCDSAELHVSGKILKIFIKGNDCCYPSIIFESHEQENKLWGRKCFSDVQESEKAVELGHVF